MLSRLPCLLLSMLPLSAFAGATADDGSCRNGAFPTEQGDFALARVGGKGRLYLLGDLEGCPTQGEPACRQRSYVVGGDTLVTGRMHGAYRCAFFPNKVGGSAGWVDADRLQVVPTSTTPALRDWAGDWTDGDNTLHLRVRDGALVATGEAFWPSARPTPQRPYGPNLGQIDAVARPRGATVDFTDSDDAGCTLQARWLGDYLIVSDNSECGGMNVRFNGVYRRDGDKH